MVELTTLAALDYIVVAIVFIASLGIGIYFACFGGKQKTSNEYFKGDSNMKLLPIVMSMLASFTTPSAILGIPAEVYYFGFNYWYINLGRFIGAAIAIYGFTPVLYKLQITSITEYLHQRFSKTVKIWTSFMNIYSLILLASFSIYAPAIALSQVTGISVWGSVLTTTIIGSIYTSIGGIKAVIWTDCLQLVMFTGALLAVIIKGSIDVGGISNIINKNIEDGRLSTLSFSPDPRIRYTIWGVLIFAISRSTALYGSSQIQLQRYMCCSNIKKVQKSIWIKILVFTPLSTIYCFTGLILYLKYCNCDPLSSQQIEKHDQLLPLFVMNTMGSVPGMPGLFVAGLYCAALSTTSSALNSLSALTVTDHVKPRWKRLSDKKSTFISKFIAAGYGLLCLLVIIAIENFGSIVQATQYLTGGIEGAYLGIFILGLMNPWANSKGALLGIISGLSISWWISLGNRIYRPSPDSLLQTSIDNCSDVLEEWVYTPKTESYNDDILEIYKISYLWIMPLASVVTVIVGSVSSLFIGSNKNINLNLLSPFVHSIMKKWFYNKYEKLLKKYKQVSNIEDEKNKINNTTKEENVNQLMNPNGNFH